MDDTLIVPLTMPKWGMAMSVGTVVQWLVEDGDAVARGQEILEIETDKTIATMEAPEDGILRRRVAVPGDELPVGALLGLLTRGDVDDTMLDACVQDMQTIPDPDSVSAESGGPTAASAEPGGVRVAYRTYPGSADPGKVPILFIHGFGGDQDSWMLNVGGIDPERTSYTFDLPGHGASSRELDDGSLPGLASLVAGLMSEMGVVRAHIVGHSLGAGVAAELCSQHPERVASLVLVGGAGSGTSVDDGYVRTFLEANRRAALKSCMERLFAEPQAVTRDMVQNTLKAKRIEGTGACLQKIAEASIFNPDKHGSNARLSELQVPVLAVWGVQDRVAPVEQAERLPANVSVRVIESAGHMVHIEAAGAFNAAVSEFLASLPS